MSYDPVVAEAARAAARQLSSQYGPRLEVEVEAALYAGGEAPPKQFTDPLTVAALIVAIAQFIYPIYTDWKKKQGEKPAKDDLARKSRVEWRQERELTPTGEKIIESISAEIIERDQ